MNEFENYFTEDGDLQEWITNKFFSEGLDGPEALAFLAEEFAGETHGNYCAETLFRRSRAYRTIQISIATKKG